MNLHKNLYRSIEYKKINGKVLTTGKMNLAKRTFFSIIVNKLIMRIFKTHLYFMVISLLISISSFCNEKDYLTKFFPTIEKMAKKDDIRIFIPENLFDYIDGAADLYLSYDFEKLAVLFYEAPDNQSLSIEIYKHKNSDCAFGVYSRMRPAGGNFIPIGAQGYYEEGKLNFFKDKYFVIMMGFNLKNEESLMKEVAQKIAQLLPGESSFPRVINKFPEKGKVANSEEFFNKDFLGYPFLKKAFTTKYEITEEESNSFTMFIIKGNDEQNAKYMLQSYLESTDNPIQENEEQKYTIEDPYYGTVKIVWYDKYLWGIYGLNNADISAKYLKIINDKFKDN